MVSDNHADPILADAEEIAIAEAESAGPLWDKTVLNSIYMDIGRLQGQSEFQHCRFRNLTVWLQQIENRLERLESQSRQ